MEHLQVYIRWSYHQLYSMDTYYFMELKLLTVILFQLLSRLLEITTRLYGYWSMELMFLYLHIYCSISIDDTARALMNRQ